MEQCFLYVSCWSSSSTFSQSSYLQIVSDGFELCEYYDFFFFLWFAVWFQFALHKSFLASSSSFLLLSFSILTVLAFFNELVNFLCTCSYFNLTINVKVIFCLTLLVCNLVDWLLEFWMLLSFVSSSFAQNLVFWKHLFCTVCKTLAMSSLLSRLLHQGLIRMFQFT